MIREGYNDSRGVSALSDSAEIFYHRLMLVVDDFGRYEADPELLRVKCFPRMLDRWPVDRVRETLDECSRTPNEDGFALVLVYTHGNKQYLEISNFNQRLRAKKARYPEPTVRQLLDTRQVSTCNLTDTCQSDDGQVSVTCGQLVHDAFSSVPFSSTTESPKNGSGKVAQMPRPETAPSWEEVSEAWKWYRDNYPGDVNEFIETQLFISVMETPEDLRQLRENLPLWKQSQKWRDGYFHSSENFLSKRIFCMKPKGAAPAKTSPTYRNVDYDENGNLVELNG